MLKLEIGTLMDIYCDHSVTASHPVDEETKNGSVSELFIHIKQFLVI